MNSYERYMSVIKREPVDFLPRVPILMQFAAEYIDSNYGTFASDYQVLVEANTRCAEVFGMDQLSTISDPYRETQGFGAEIEFIRDGVPRCLHPPLENRKDLSLLKDANPLKSERMLDRIRAVRSFQKQFQDVYSIMGWIAGPAAEAAHLRGAGNFLMDTIEDPPFCEELMDRCMEVGVDFARTQIDAGADTISLGDAIASQISPQAYNRFIQPREKRLIQTIQSMGAFVRLHICGNITHLLSGIADLGVDLLDVDHMVDMVKVRETVGGNVVITGNINPVDVLTETPDSIRETIARIYKKVGNPYMVNAGCEIPAGTPVENLKALCEPVPYCS